VQITLGIEDRLPSFIVPHVVSNEHVCHVL
jgi:hypothetical protein